MGNFLLKEMGNAANNNGMKLSFENIFMNADDVDEDIFSIDKNPLKEHDGDDMNGSETNSRMHRKGEGAHIVDMQAKSDEY